MPELSLRTIPGYVVDELLETDLVSATYLAERESDGYPVVLQVVAAGVDDPESTAFFDAYELLKRVKHPVLPAVWDVGRIDGALYSVTDAVEGRSLASTLARSGRLSVDTALAVCSELADALDILHAADVVHGALNPYTVWINDRERAPSAPWVTLRGFGTTPLLSQRASSERVDPPPADLYYVAPEQIRRDEVTGRADQYALGCMVVHCLTGAPPFERSTVNALIGAHLFAAPRATDGRWDALPPYVVAAVQRAMAKDPADRFALCDAFAIAIGGNRQRSWSWMIADALDQSPDGEPPDSADTGYVAALDWEGDTAASQTFTNDERERSREMYDDVTIRTLAEADWLPGGSTEPAFTQRPAVTERPAFTEHNDIAEPAAAGHATPADPAATARITPTRPAAPRRATPTMPAAAERRAPADSLPRFSLEAATTRRVDPQLLRWLVILAASIIILMALLLLQARSADRPATESRQDAQHAPEPAVPPPQISPAWQRTTTKPITTMIHTDESVVSAAGDVISVMDAATGKPRWQAAIGDEVVEIAALEHVVVVRTGDALHGLDERTGHALWNTDDPIARSALAVGHTSLYAVAVDGETSSLSLRALAPATGEVQWAIDGLAAAGPDTSAVYDRSRIGEQMLYLLSGSRLHAVDTSARRVRWQTTLEQPEVGSLTAIAKAIVVINAKGEICRYGMQDGNEVWTRCATLQGAPGAHAVVHTRHARVLVRSTREIAAVDFTSGVPHWRVTDTTGFQDAFAANTDTAFVVHADGSIEAIDHQRGVERWRSQPLGEVSAMTAGGDAIYVATADRRLLRFDAANDKATRENPSPATAR
jgi:outer membrane protein assembly factor BamB